MRAKPRQRCPILIEFDGDLVKSEMLASDAERQALIGSWMSGYFSASKNLETLDFRYVERNRRVVGNYCKTHKSETVMSAMQKNWR